MARCTHGMELGMKSRCLLDRLSMQTSPDVAESGPTASHRQWQHSTPLAFLCSTASLTPIQTKMDFQYSTVHPFCSLSTMHHNEMGLRPRWWQETASPITCEAHDCVHDYYTLIFSMYNLKIILVNTSVNNYLKSHPVAMVDWWITGVQKGKQTAPIFREKAVPSWDHNPCSLAMFQARQP